MTIEPISPSIQFFHNESSKTQTAILEDLLQIIEKSLGFSPEKFIQNIAAKEVIHLSDLDVRTQILFKNIVFVVLHDLVTNPTYAAVLNDLIMKSMLGGDMSAHGRFLRVTALPHIQTLADLINAHDPEILINTTSTPANEAFLKNFGVV